MHQIKKKAKAAIISCLPIKILSFLHRVSWKQTFEKWQICPFCSGHSKAKWSFENGLSPGTEVQNAKNIRNDSKTSLGLFYAKNRREETPTFRKLTRLRKLAKMAILQWQ